ncbi:hypothetical protein [Pyxidicoccus caerfyrddinensis]|uniref:hypothetical protein n=1 Tax=Pyxidicoccus caerfyrddinensis TaxID=2709663 RepID=UPI0013DBAB0D|nr:hypothetical protein [Pyxidicoccus caerfyrddinensis]
MTVKDLLRGWRRWPADPRLIPVVLAVMRQPDARLWEVVEELREPLDGGVVLAGD